MARGKRLPAAKQVQREEIFAMNLLACKFNATQAAIMSGFPPTSAAGEASRLIKKPNVQAILAREFTAIIEAKRVKIEDIVAELKLLGFSNMMDYVVNDGSGNLALDFSSVTRDQMAAVKSITVEEYTEGRGDNARNVKRTKFELYDKLGPLKLLMQYVQAMAGRPAIPGDGATIVNNFNGPTQVNNGEASKDAMTVTGEYQKLLDLTPEDYRRAHGDDGTP